MTQTHEFKERLSWSEAAGHEPFWNAVYGKAFPNLVNHMMCSGDTQSQRMGIDRILYLGNGLTVAIDEKKRDKDYGDMLLEYISVDTTNAPGWMEKDLAIDYLAYAVMPKKQCYLFPWQLMRRVWLKFGQEWIATAKENEQKLKEGKGHKNNGYRIIEARNRTYSTWSVAVPMSMFRERLSLASVIDVSVELEGWIPPAN